MGGERPVQTLPPAIENIAGIVRATKNLSARRQSDSTSADERRRRLADFLKHIGEVFTGKRADRAAAPPAVDAKIDNRVSTLTPRVQQTLLRMLAGDSEKEIGIRLGVSKHTVHVYVKTLYRHFAVNSRGELLAHFVRPGANLGLSPV